MDANGANNEISIIIKIDKGKFICIYTCICLIYFLSTYATKKTPNIVKIILQQQSFT